MRSLLVIGMAIVLSGCAEKPPAPPGSEPGTPSPAPSPRVLPVLRFAAVGDTGTGESGAYRVAAQIGRKCAESGCDFIALLGDNVYPEGVSSVDDPQWEDKVRVPYLSLGYPVRPVLGNHDYGGQDGRDLDRAEAQLAYSAVEPLWEMPARVHALDADPALLLFFDTEPIRYDAIYGSNQAAYFRPIVASSEKPWRIAFGHSPLLSNGAEHGSAYGEREAFLRAVLCDGVDVYLAGHDHHREVLALRPECPVTSVVSGAGAIWADVETSVPALFTSTSLGFAYVTVDPELLTLEMIDVDGRTDFVTTLNRSQGKRRPEPSVW